eukprot:GSChrysophyteH1.ASY1.ANO1.1534.1 assembled CDS
MNRFSIMSPLLAGLSVQGIRRVRHCRLLSVSAAVKSPEGKKHAGPNIPKSRRLAPIALTSKAADRIKELIGGKENAVGVHLSVKRRGCNGYSYIMNYATDDQVKAGKDEIVQDHGVTVLVDPKAVFFIVGTTMDWNETELASEFTFINPNVKGECGCGESFNM